MQERQTSAVVRRVFPVTGRGWALELTDLEGAVEAGDWMHIQSTPHGQRAVQVTGVEFVDDRPGHRAAVAVVVRKLKTAVLERLQGQRVFFSHEAQPGGHAHK